MDRQKLMLEAMAVTTYMAIIFGSLAVMKFVYETTEPVAPPECLQAPEVVGGWHTVTGRPEAGYVCGWHQVSVPEPVYRCVRMEPCR